jgi:translation elongation factor EF-Tu-like GTPase
VTPGGFAFGLHGVTVIGDAVTVIGRCYAGVLRVGAVFTSVVAPDGTAAPAHLAILRIEAYQRDLDQLEEGLTARLTLRGTAAAALLAGAVLHGGPP